MASAIDPQGQARIAVAWRHADAQPCTVSAASQDLRGRRPMNGRAAQDELVARPRRGFELRAPAVAIDLPVEDAEPVVLLARLERSEDRLGLEPALPREHHRGQGFADTDLGASASR